MSRTGACFICKEEGHWSVECPNRNAKRQRVQGADMPSDATKIPYIDYAEKLFSSAVVVRAHPVRDPAPGLKRYEHTECPHALCRKRMLSCVYFAIKPVTIWCVSCQVNLQQQNAYQHPPPTPPPSPAAHLAACNNNVQAGPSSSSTQRGVKVPPIGDEEDDEEEARYLFDLGGDNDN
jgi:Zinc knuckle